MNACQTNKIELNVKKMVTSARMKDFSPALSSFAPSARGSTAVGGFVSGGGGWGAEGVGPTVEEGGAISFAGSQRNLTFATPAASTTSSYSQK